jgi:cell cycle sensor histidine kinase DivJ
MLAHELRTPLNAVLGYAEAMRDELFGPLSDPYREQAGLIHAAASHLLAVVEAMTATAAGEAGERTLALERLGPRDLETLLADAVRLAGARAASLDLGVRAATGLPAAARIQADRVALSQILINLIDNAMKFTASGGMIAVGAELAGGDVRLTVGNGGGEGPPAGEAGQGLGLRLARALSEAMGGSLDVEVSPGGAARAVVRLPAITGP